VYLLAGDASATAARRPAAANLRPHAAGTRRVPPPWPAARPIFPI